MIDTYICNTLTMRQNLYTIIIIINIIIIRIE